MKLNFRISLRGRGQVGEADDDGGEWTKCFFLRDERGRETKDPGRAAHVISAGHRPTLSGKEWAAMGSFLSASTKVKQLYLRECGMSNARDVSSLFGKGRRHDSPLEAFTSKGNRFGARGLEAALPHLRSAPGLRKLTLDGANLQLEGCVLLSRAMESMHITSLQLRENNIGDDGAAALLSGDACRNLISLSLSGNKIGRRGLASISEFLNRDGTMCQHLAVANNAPMDEGCAADFVDSLPRESELVRLSFGDVGMKDDRDRAVAAAPNLEKLLCDTDSFESLCRSNHRLRWLCATEEDPKTPTNLGRKFFKGSPFLREALDINGRSETSRNEKLRFKLRAFYFKGRFDVRPFVDVDVRLIPRILEFVTTTVVRADGAYVRASKGDLGGIYRFVRGWGPPSLIRPVTPPVEERRRLESTISAMQLEVERLRRENEQLRLQISALL